MMYFHLPSTSSCVCYRPLLCRTAGRPGGRRAKITEIGPLFRRLLLHLLATNPFCIDPSTLFRAFNNCHTRVRPSGPNNVNSRPWTNGRPVGQRSSDAVPLVRLCLRFFLFLPSASFLGQRVGRLNKQKHCASDSLNGQFCGLVFVAHVHPTV